MANLTRLIFIMCLLAEYRVRTDNILRSEKSVSQFHIGQDRLMEELQTRRKLQIKNNLWFRLGTEDDVVIHVTVSIDIVSVTVVSHNQIDLAINKGLVHALCNFDSLIVDIQPALIIPLRGVDIRNKLNQRFTTCFDKSIRFTFGSLAKYGGIKIYCFVLCKYHLSPRHPLPADP